MNFSVLIFFSVSSLTLLFGNSKAQPFSWTVQDSTDIGYCYQNFISNLIAFRGTPLTDNSYPTLTKYYGDIFVEMYTSFEEFKKGTAAVVIEGVSLLENVDITNNAEQILGEIKQFCKNVYLLRPDVLDKSKMPGRSAIFTTLFKKAYGALHYSSIRGAKVSKQEFDQEFDKICSPNITVILQQQQQQQQQQQETP